MLPWFENGNFPIYLAPMAGVTDVVFRSLCKELGADVMVTEFVSAEGIIRQDDRTKKYTEFDDGQRPVGVQIFGGDGVRMAEALEEDHRLEAARLHRHQFRLSSEQGRRKKTVDPPCSRIARRSPASPRTSFKASATSSR